MLKTLNHAAHLIGEAMLGILGVAVLATCVLAWLLSQGPLDVTRLIQREGRLLNAKGSHVSIAVAALAWEKSDGRGARLDILVQDVAAHADDGSLRLVLKRARVDLSISDLLRGRIAPRTILVDGADILADLGANGSGSANRPAAPAWLRRLTHVAIHGSALRLRGMLPGTELRAMQAAMDLTRTEAGGLSGTIHLELAAGTTSSVLDAHAVAQGNTTVIDATSNPVRAAALAGLSPSLAGLRALELPVGLELHAVIDAGLQLDQARLLIQAGAGTVHAGRGSVAVSSITANLALRPNELLLERLTVAPASPPGPGATGAPPPVVTCSGAATLTNGRVHATFAADIPRVEFADLPWYWPEGTGGGARDWLVQNVPAGHAHDAHVAGTLNGRADLSDLALTTLSGGIVADDVTLFWLRPVPPLEHAQAHVILDGPDALHVVVDKGGQNNLVLSPGSAIRVTGLSAKDQFGDIDIGLSGAVPDALGVLNHPRLALLSRGGLDVAGAAGDVSARLKMHVPLEDRVGMDDIAVAATAGLQHLHLSNIAGGRNLDDGDLALKVDNDGLTASGTASVAGIAARLGLTMDFRTGPQGQVLQHVTAAGSTTPSSLAAAGVPPGVAALLTAGSAGLAVDYVAYRGGTGALRVDADLARAAVSTPLGWSKKAGEPATLGGKATLDHGRLTGVDDLHAEGPGLSLISRAQFSGGVRTLALEQLRIGRTSAHGQVVFPAIPAGPVRLSLSGDMLDLSSQLDPPKSPAAKAQPISPETDDDTPGQAWAAELGFAHVQLSRGNILSPLSLDAASDGRRILHAQLHAGGAGEVSAAIVPSGASRTLAISASDAGVALRALGIADNLAGGRLQLAGIYNDAQPGSPLSGTATLTEFNLRDAPAIGRLLQAMTLYGLTDLARGPGLHFSRLVAPFRWHRRILTLTSARAFSPSLGITAQGTLDLRRHVANMTGTVVPAYFFNQLLGDLPVIGKLFSPEKGGGLFAARYSVRGPLADPKVGVNALSALTPGFLREGFGLLSPKR